MNKKFNGALGLVLLVAVIGAVELIISSLPFRADLTAEKLDAEWESKYLPALKWEILDANLNKIKSIEPSHNDIVDYVKDILKRNDRSESDETPEAKEERIEKAAQSIASDRNNVSQIVDRLYAEKTFELFKEQIRITKEVLHSRTLNEEIGNLVFHFVGIRILGGNDDFSSFLT